MVKFLKIWYQGQICSGIVEEKKSLLNFLPSTWLGTCTIVQLGLPVTVIGQRQKVQQPRNLSRQSTLDNFDLTQSVNAMGIPRGVPDEYKLANPTVNKLEFTVLWITPNKNFLMHAQSSSYVDSKRPTLERWTVRSIPWSKISCFWYLMSRCRGIAELDKTVHTSS